MFGPKDVDRNLQHRPDWLLNSVSIDLHLHDTLFAVGTVHLECLTPGLALLGLIYCRWNDHINRPGRERLAWVGFILIAIGSHVMTWSMLAMGRRGMPRGYHWYLDLFQSFHIACTMGAVLLVVGITMAIAALLCARSGNRDAVLHGTTK